ncbi:MAG: hypothetical protein R3320_09880, partial [Nitriliruptorales bacterium]|nr:hypothetical protein [Nitriliruptorales bacterium]
LENAILYRNDERISFHAEAAYVVEHLLWDLNRRALEVHDDLLLLHAGAVVHDGVGLLLPAEPGAGKSTLTAGLVRDGAGYLSEEIAVVDSTRPVLRSHQSPLVIKGESRDLLADLRPSEVATLAPHYIPDRWHVAGSAIRRGALARQARPRLIITPNYVIDGRTELTPVSRATMVGILASQTLRPRDRHGRTLERLRDLAAATSCYRLTYGDLEDACRIVAHVAAAVGREQRP